MQSHFLHMLIYATIVSVFLAVLIRNTRRERLRLGLWLWLVMVGGSLLLAYAMVPLPN